MGLILKLIGITIECLLGVFAHTLFLALWVLPALVYGAKEKKMSFRQYLKWLGDE